MSALLLNSFYQAENLGEDEERIIARLADRWVHFREISLISGEIPDRLRSPEIRLSRIRRISVCCGFSRLGLLAWESLVS